MHFKSKIPNCSKPVLLLNTPHYYFSQHFEFEALCYFLTCRVTALSSNWTNCPKDHLNTIALTSNFQNSCSSDDVCFQNLNFYPSLPSLKKDASPTAAAANKLAIYWSLWCSKVKLVEWILKPTFFTGLFHFFIRIYVTAVNWIT